jgi:DNA-binding transcriptional LysR family regulator
MASDRPLPNLSIQHLDYLRAVLGAPTWALAAAEVGVTPSALSQGLGELERRLGVPLFEREGRRRVLRPDAAPVAAYAERVLAQTQDLTRWAAEARSGRAGRVRLGMIDAAAVDHFPDTVRAFRDQRPEVDLHLTVAPSAGLLASLARGELDVVVCIEPGAPTPGTTTSPLLDEALYVYAPAGHPGGPDTWGPWVAFPAGSHTRALVADAVRAAGAPFEVVAESHQPEVLREMVRLGLGWAVLPAAGHVDRASASPARVGAGPLLWRRLVAARRTDALANPAADALLADLVADAAAASPAA